eukprot:139610_1
MDHLKAIQTDVYDLSAKEMISNVLKPLDIFKMIATHEIDLGECKWVDIISSLSFPSMITLGAFTDIRLFLLKEARESRDILRGRSPTPKLLK